VAKDAEAQNRSPAHALTIWVFLKRTEFAIGRLIWELPRMRSREGKTWIMLKVDPSLVMAAGEVTELLRPHRVFEGAPTFEIALRTASDLPLK